jgi:hypothetical protein
VRKYRNIKGNLQPKRILKYSEEWIQYRKSRGADSVKTEHCDIDADGHLDAIVRAWRSPALKKLQICGYLPTGGPSNVQVSQDVPQTGPVELQAALLAPQNGPSEVLVSEVVPAPTTGPTELSSIALFPPTTGPATLTSQALAPSTGPTVLTSQVAVPPIATKIYIRPEVRFIPFSGSRAASGTDLATVYNNYNFSHGATTGTACNTYGTNCLSVYNMKNGFATNIPGTAHLGGLYELSTPVTSTNPFYTRTHKLDLVNNVYIADTDNSKPTLVRSNNSHTGWTDMWQLRWDFKPEANFNFGGMFDWTLISTPDEAWHIIANGTTGSINNGDIDLTNLVNAWFRPYSNTTGFNGTYRITSALKT